MHLNLKTTAFLSFFLMIVCNLSFAQQASKHTVSKGESIYTIAKKYQVSEADIYELNPSLKGKVLQLNAVVSIPFRKDENGNIIVETHTVAAGETLNIIAEKHKMSTSALSKLNPTVDSRRLKIGMVLNLTDTNVGKIKNVEIENNSNENIGTHTIASGETLSSIANKYNMSLAELSKLNPSADSRRLHVGTVLKVSGNSLTTSKTTEISQKTHTVASGETLSIIANNYNLSLQTITKLNPTIDARRLHVGTVLKLTEDAVFNENTTSETVKSTEKTSENNSQNTHIVAPGETLGSIATKYNMSLAALTSLNPTVDAKRLHVGTALKIVKDEAVQTNNEETKVEIPIENLVDKKIQKTHFISSGETLKIIADKYNMSLSALRKLNPKADSRRLKVGQKIFVETVETNPITVLEKTSLEKTVITKPLKTHKIKSGDTFKSIAKKYNVSVNELTKLNPKIEPRNLKIGTVVKLNTPESIMVAFNKNESALNAQTSEAEDLLHKVLPNETKYGIAKKYGITIEKIDELNPEIKDKLPIDYLLVIKRGTKSLEELKPEVIEESKKSETTAVIAEILIDNASKYMGVSYRSGGTSARGFDCSGLMYTTFKEIDLSLPRSSRSMARVGEVVSKSTAQKGDLIFFATGRKGTISHVGMVTEVNGDEIKFIHSSTSSGVIISSLKEDYYARRFVQINRVLN